MTNRTPQQLTLDGYLDHIGTPAEMHLTIAIENAERILRPLAKQILHMSVSHQAELLVRTYEARHLVDSSIKKLDKQLLRGGEWAAHGMVSMDEFRGDVERLSPRIKHLRVLRSRLKVLDSLLKRRLRDARSPGAADVQPQIHGCGDFELLVRWLTTLNAAAVTEIGAEGHLDAVWSALADLLAAEAKIHVIHPPSRHLQPLCAEAATPGYPNGPPAGILSAAA